MVYAANGTPPFGRDSIAVLAHRIVHEPPELGALSGRLRDLVTDCLAKDPARRPDASTLLMRLLGHEAPLAGDDARTAILAEGVTAAVPEATMPAPRAAGAAPRATADGPGHAAGRADDHPADARPEHTAAAAGYVAAGGRGPTDGGTGPRPAGAAAPPAKRRTWPLVSGALLGALGLTAGMIVAWAALRHHAPPPHTAPTTTIYTSATRNTERSQPANTDAHGSSSHSRPAPEPTFLVHPTGCDLGMTGVTCTITLRGEGAGFDWTGTAHDPLSISSHTGHLDPGGTTDITITLHPATPRAGGASSVTFIGAGGSHTVAVTWQGPPDPSST